MMKFKTRTETPESIKAFCSDPNIVAYSSMLLRPGLYAWMVEVEYTKFKPDTDANSGFHIFGSKFPQDSSDPLFMMTVAIDRSGQEFAESILWRHGLRKCKPGFVPVVFDANGQHPFFLQGPNVFYLENHSDGAQNVIYTNDMTKLEAALEHEKKQAQKFFDEHEAWLKTPEGKATYEAYWKKHPEGHVY